MTTVEIRPFGEVDEALAWDEGEGDRSLASWRRATGNRYPTKRQSSSSGARRSGRHPEIRQLEPTTFVRQAGVADGPTVGTGVGGPGLGVGGLLSSTFVPGISTRTQPGSMWFGS
jgi:hypothetical protein